MNIFGVFGGMFGPSGGMGQPDIGVGMNVMPQDASMYGAGMCMGMMPQDACMMPGFQDQGMFGVAPGMCGYGYQPPVGRMDYSGFVKYTRQQMLDGLRNYVIMCNQGRIAISKEEKIDETPQLLRHACAECGVSHLQMLMFNIPEAGIQIPFYFCTACGKLFYYKDFAA